MAKLSWFNETRLHLATEGMIIEDRKHQFDPIFNNGVTKGVECPKCKQNKAFHFKSIFDERVTVAACLSCREISIITAVDKAPESAPVKVSKTTCGCGAGLPAGRTKFCHTCWPPAKKS